MVMVRATVNVILRVMLLLLLLLQLGLLLLNSLLEEKSTLKGPFSFLVNAANLLHLCCSVLMKKMALLQPFHCSQE